MKCAIYAFISREETLCAEFSTLRAGWKEFSSLARSGAEVSFFTINNGTAHLAVNSVNGLVWNGKDLKNIYSRKPIVAERKLAAMWKLRALALKNGKVF